MPELPGPIRPTCHVLTFWGYNDKSRSRTPLESVQHPKIAADNSRPFLPTEFAIAYARSIQYFWDGSSNVISSFRFVHCADLHIDAPLKSLALRNPELADLVASATRRAFVAIVDLCLDEKVDALLISGDLYDGDQTSMKTAGFIAAQLRRLHNAGILTFGIRGNHDAMSRITTELVFPDSVTFFKGSAGATCQARPAVGTS